MMHTLLTTTFLTVALAGCTFATMARPAERESPSGTKANPIVTESGIRKWWDNGMVVLELKTQPHCFDHDGIGYCGYSHADCEETRRAGGATAGCSPAKTATCFLIKRPGADIKDTNSLCHRDRVQCERSRALDFGNGLVAGECFAVHAPR